MNDKLIGDYNLCSKHGPYAKGIRPCPKCKDENSSVVLPALGDPEDWQHCPLHGNFKFREVENGICPACHEGDKRLLDDLLNKSEKDRISDMGLSQEQHLRIAETHCKKGSPDENCRPTRESEIFTLASHVLDCISAGCNGEEAMKGAVSLWRDGKVSDLYENISWADVNKCLCPKPDLPAGRLSSGPEQICIKCKYRVRGS